MSKLSKRGLRCLKRIDAGKSICDIGAMDELEKKGFIVCTFDDGEMEINQTEKSKTFLADEFVGCRYTNKRVM